MWTELLIGFSLMFVIEGLILAVFPEYLRKAVHEIMQLPANTLRVTGVGSMLFGLILLLIFH